MPRGKSKSPNAFHPVKHSAVGSKNSTNQSGRDQDKEFERFVNDATEKLIKRITHKLPPEALQKLDVMGGVKEKLYNYVNQSYVNMFNRYLTTVEDEMAKKVRDFVDREELKASNRYNAKEIAELLDQVGGPEKFNTGEIEKSTVNMYGHLQGHIQRGMTDLEQETNALLRQKSDVGAFVRGQNFYSVVKCTFQDSKQKPRTVMNVKLSLNILDNELISPIFHHQSTVEYIVKDMITNHIMEKLDTVIEETNDRMIEEGKSELNHTEQIIKKVGTVETFTSDDRDDDKSSRYTFLAKHLMERIEGLRAEINPKDYDALNVRENVKKVFDDAKIRIRGFNTAINNLTSILDTSKLGYQYCENMKNCREFLIREYEETDEAELPDERYEIKLKYYDMSQVLAERRAYDKQVQDFQNETKLCSDIADKLYRDNKKRFILNDWGDLVNKTKSWRKKQLQEGDILYEESPKSWDELIEVPSEETEVEKANRTYNQEKTQIKKRLQVAKQKMNDIFGHRNPKARIILDERILFLETQLAKFEHRINPYHIQPGMLMEMDIVTTKRKRYIMNGMSNVLNEFLSSISKGFTDAAFAAFSRRRSTIRDDIDQEFVTDLEEPGQSDDVPAYEKTGSVDQEAQGVEEASPNTSPEEGDLDEL